MSGEILNLKHKFHVKGQDDTFYNTLIKYSNSNGFNKIVTDEWLKAHNYQCYCYTGALYNMYYFNQNGKDVIFHFGNAEGGNSITHAWVEVEGKEYHINRPGIRRANGTMYYYETKSLESKFIPASTAKTDIPKLFIKTNTLTEDTRTLLVSKSRSTGQYKDTSRGKNRFERKKFSKIANTVKQYNQIDMNDLFKKDLLQVSIPVVGETNTYFVTIKMDGVVAEIAKNIKNNQNKLEYRTIIQALTKVFNTANIYVKCTCDDYKYRFAHWNIINNVSADDTSKDPGPGRGIANPNDDKGRGCKHILLTLANGDWIMKVASVINNYIHYAEEHLQKPFLKVIFPKLYGVSAEEAIENDLLDDDKYLDSSKGMIDAINEYGRNRGKYKAGTNKNPVTGTGGRAKKEPKSQEKAETNSKQPKAEKRENEPKTGLEQGENDKEDNK